MLCSLVDVYQHWEEPMSPIFMAGRRRLRLPLLDLPTKVFVCSLSHMFMIHVHVVVSGYRGNWPAAPAVIANDSHLLSTPKTESSIWNYFVDRFNISTIIMHILLWMIRVIVLSTLQVEHAVFMCTQDSAHSKKGRCFSTVNIFLVLTLAISNSCGNTCN